jgi:glycosyltransferase involved in cell wall biosynthesis
MHIAQALAALTIGGSELVAVEISEHLIAQGNQASMIGAGGPLSGRVAAAGINHVDWDIGRKQLATLRYIKRLTNWLREQKVTVLHAHSRLPAWICWRALKRLDPKKRPAFITTMHGHHSVNPYSAIMTRGDLVLAVSDHIRNYTLQNYPGVNPKKVITLHGGINRDEFWHKYQPDQGWTTSVFERFPELAGKKLLSLPGRLTRWKGHREFIRLLALLKSRVADIQGVIIGGCRPGSAYKNKLIELAEQEGVSRQITFTGETAEMREWLAISDIVYNLSSNPPEALGRTVLEALSLGRPVLAWDHGGAGEILDRLYPEGKVPLMDMEMLTNRSLEMLENTIPVPETGAFGLRESMEKHLAIYQQLAEAR